MRGRIPGGTAQPYANRRSRAILLAAAVCAALAAGRPSAGAELVIRVVGLRSESGTVQFAVYDRPQGFPTYEGRVAKGQTPVNARGAVIRLSALMPGTYAVAVFHDENGNGSFDQGFLGIPLEDYGFSNNAGGFFGPPSFESAAFALIEPRSEIVIDLRK